MNYCAFNDVWFYLRPMNDSVVCFSFGGSSTSFFYSFHSHEKCRWIESSTFSTDYIEMTIATSKPKMAA